MTLPMRAREGLAFANPSQTAHIRVMHRTFAPHVHRELL